MHPSRPRKPGRPSVPTGRMIALALLVLAACGGDPAGARQDTIEPAQFVTAWVELRRATITSESGELTDSLRRQALERAGVTEEQFVAFSDVHGGDLEFMQPVWDSIETRLDSTVLLFPRGNEPPPPGPR